MTIEFDIRPKFSNLKNEVRVNERELALWEARLASLLIEKWGMVSARPDGEDSSGRQKLAVMTPSEVVDRACSTADLAVAEFRRRGWVVVMPSLAEIDAAAPKED